MKASNHERVGKVELSKLNKERKKRILEEERIEKKRTDNKLRDLEREKDRIRKSQGREDKEMRDKERAADRTRKKTELHLGHILYEKYAAHI